MKVQTIFEVVKDKLYVIQWDTKQVDELIDLFGDESIEHIGQWEDVESLRNFFNEFGQDLRSDFWGITRTRDAVKRTIREATILKQRLVDFAESKNEDNLDELFTPLNNGIEQHEYQEHKAYGPEHKSWLRVYAIRISENRYVITGGAIKLTPTMNTRIHLQQELYKLHNALQYLIENNFIEI